MAIPFNLIIEKILNHEGGYVNDPTDLGGETKYGITKRFYPDLDIKNLTKDEAKAIYKKDYWDRNRVEELPDDIRYIFFDMCINQGRKTAVKVLQRAANSINSKKIDVDGGMGPATRKAAEGVSSERIRAYRIMHYTELVLKKPEQEKFWFGWFRRALEV